MGLVFSSYDIVETGYPVRERLLLYTCILVDGRRIGEPVSIYLSPCGPTTYTILLFQAQRL